MQACYIGLGDGREWFFDEENLTLADYFVIKAAAGLSRVKFLEGILDEDPAALQVLVWFLRRRTEPDLPLASVDFKPAALTVRPAVESPSPTGASPSDSPPTGLTDAGSSDSPTPSSSATATSGSSPAGAASDLVTSTA